MIVFLNKLFRFDKVLSKKNFIMKKLITIMSLAVAPVLFAQEKAQKASIKNDVKTEQQLKEQKKSDQIEAQKKAEADKKAAAENKQAKKSEIKATEKRTTSQNGQKAQSLK